MKKKLLTTFILLGIWQVASMIISKEVILPLPLDVFSKMLSFLTQVSFYEAVIASLSRITLSFMIAFVLGTLLGILSGLYKSIYEFLYPIFALLQTIPQIGYILVLLVWFNSFTALIIIVLLMLSPSFYHNAYQGIMNIDDTLNDVISLYHHSLSYNIVHVYIPLIKGYVLSAINNCLPLSLKVGVMAEIFVSSAKGIGKELYIARVNIDMVSIFAWILWMVVIILSISAISQKLVNKLNNE